ncbi:MAG: ABC transporter ATP-binding protein [Spirochaetales bacterium]|nr:ABC transporter ATP-binding protein [Spirochaetales bacterium]
MIDLRLKGVSKSYGKNTVVKSLDMKIASGELIALLGPSGCGKTTILKIIAGLQQPDEGTVFFGRQVMNSVPAEKREAVMVFQNYLLFPFMTVEENIAFGLKMRRTDKAVIKERVNEILALIRMEGMGRRKPSELSGGQKQRVALARALVLRPQLLLLDEPLSNLDAHLRDEMRELILRVHREFQVTTVFVTHDQEEAVLLADRIALIFEGNLHQFAPVRDFYERPQSERVASFFGNSNFLKGFCSGQAVETELGAFKTPLTGENESGRTVSLMIRPEHIIPGKGEDNSFLCPIRSKIYMGSFIRYRIEVGEGLWDVIDGPEARKGYEEGESAWFTFPPHMIWLV